MKCGAAFGKYIGLEFHMMATRGERCEEFAPNVVRIVQCAEPGCLNGADHYGPHENLQQLVDKMVR